MVLYLVLGLIDVRGCLHFNLGSGFMQGFGTWLKKHWSQGHWRLYRPQANSIWITTNICNTINLLRLRIHDTFWIRVRRFVHAIQEVILLVRYRNLWFLSVNYCRLCGRSKSRLESQRWCNRFWLRGDVCITWNLKKCLHFNILNIKVNEDNSSN